MQQNKKIALVTGASRGIGAAIAQKLVEQGVYVIGTATTDSGAESIKNTLGENGQGYKIDVTSLADIENLFEYLNTSKMVPDILVNNAGITRDNLIIRMTEEDWSSVINTNLNAIFSISKRCAKLMMKKRWGRIISTGSVVGSMGNPGQTNYCAAKAGVIGFSKSLACEIASRNITVNVVSPGFIETDMTNKLNDDQKKSIKSKIPSQRLGNPEDIANTVAFLASENASYITGQTVHVNGGMYMN